MEARSGMANTHERLSQRVSCHHRFTLRRAALLPITFDCLTKLVRSLRQIIDNVVLLPGLPVNPFLAQALATTVSPIRLLITGESLVIFSWFRL